MFYARLPAVALLTALALPGMAIETVPHQWIATRADGARADWALLSARAGVRLVRTFGPQDRFALWESRGGNEPLPTGDEIRIQPNFVYHTVALGDPELGNSWGLINQGQSAGSLGPGVAGRDIGASQAWNIATGDHATVVAVIDTGIDFAHEELAANLWNAPGTTTSHGWNILTGTDDAHDDNGHGTFCAGLIGAEANNGVGSRGVTWQVSLMSIKSFDATNYGTTADEASAIQWAVEHGARILNASWGGTGYDQALYDMVNWAGNQGAVLVAAAGNLGADNGGGDGIDGGITYPAAFALPNVISVAAYDNRDQIASFSNYGKQTVHLGAPGVGIFSTVPGGYKWDDGTSYSAAYVSGAAALLLSYVPSLSATDLRDRLLKTTAVISYYEKERLMTAGRINLYNALEDIRPPRPQAPKYWTSTPQSYSTPHPYANNAHYHYEIRHPGATHIRAHFSRFSTEKKYDTLTLTDAQGQTVYVYSGNLGGDLTSADALGDTLILDFTSDNVQTDYGFDIDSDDASYGDSMSAQPDLLSAPLGILLLQ
jgi:subtilisin family serine protease